MDSVAFRIDADKDTANTVPPPIQLVTDGETVTIVLSGPHREIVISAKGLRRTLSVLKQMEREG